MTRPGGAIVRIPSDLWATMAALLMHRYPHQEWATFYRFGWTLANGRLVLSLVEAVHPLPGDMDESVAHVKILEEYSLRAVLSSLERPLALGVIHSHPEDCGTTPSRLDDDMDGYYQGYIGDFLPGRPYLSLIVARGSDGELRFSGRAWLDGRAFEVEHTALVGPTAQFIDSDRNRRIVAPAHVRERVSRAAAALGDESLNRLWRSTVAVVGVGGTGSVVAHVLARAGVGRLVLIDRDHLAASNVERVHGSEARHAEEEPLKVALVRDLCRRVNPDMEIVAVEGNSLQPLARELLVGADLIVGCTDTVHSRVGLSELSYRFGVPVVDVGVQLDGARGRISSEVIQIVYYFPGGPCAYCRSLVDPQALAAELMTADEVAERRAMAKQAALSGVAPDQYWRDAPQLLTVGHLTTTAGGLAASYAIGLVTGTFAPPSSFFQFDMVAPALGFVGVELAPKSGCSCVERRCFSDQGQDRAVISAPKHWPPARIV